MILAWVKDNWPITMGQVSLGTYVDKWSLVYQRSFKIKQIHQCHRFNLKVEEGFLITII